MGDAMVLVYGDFTPFEFEGGPSIEEQKELATTIASQLRRLVQFTEALVPVEKKS